MSDKSHKCAVWTERAVVECLTWWYVEQPLGFEGVNYVLCSENLTGRVTVCRMYCTGWQGNIKMGRRDIRCENVGVIHIFQTRV